ncbi:MFS transporter [Salipiger sp. IMCC34102]|nr:MFS transporter [Salipiger sp. IMCC34102]
MVAVLAFAGLTASFMQTIVIPIQGILPRLLDADAANTAWVITITLLTAAISTPIAGRLGDMFGKHAVALSLMGILLAGSVVCALASGLLPMIAGRALQGLGMGVIPLGISLLRDLVDSRRLGTSIALVSATMGVGGAIGMPVSALVTQHLDWHMLFILASLLAALSIALIYFIVRRTGIRSGGHVDLVGVAGLTVGLSGVLLAISRGSSWGWGSAPTLLSLAIGLMALAAFAIYELRIPNPLVDIRVSARSAVLTTNLASVAMGFALFSASVAFPQILQLPVASGGLGVDLFTASLMLVPAGFAMLVMSPVAGRIERTAGPRILLILAAMVLLIAYIGCLVIPLGAIQIAIINTVVGTGIGLGYAAMPALIMNAVPRNETGAANGLNALMRAFGTTLAAAVVGSVIAASHGQGGSFESVFLMGVVASAACAILAFFIPSPQAEGEVAVV